MAQGESYNQCVEKFKPKLTTDDSYTPAAVYDCVKQYVNDNVCHLDGHRIVRPFYPGGDYEHYDYHEGDKTPAWYYRAALRFTVMVLLSGIALIMAWAVKFRKKI